MFPDVRLNSPVPIASDPIRFTTELRGGWEVCWLGDKKGHVALPADFSSKPNIHTSYFWIFPYGRVLAYGAGEPMGLLVWGSPVPSSWLSVDLAGCSDPCLCRWSPQCRDIQKNPHLGTCARVPLWGCISEPALPREAWPYTPADKLLCHRQGGRGGTSKIKSIQMFACLDFCIILISMFPF